MRAETFQINCKFQFICSASNSLVVQIYRTLLSPRFVIQVGNGMELDTVGRQLRRTSALYYWTDTRSCTTKSRTYFMPVYIHTQVFVLAFFVASMVALRALNYYSAYPTDIELYDDSISRERVILTTWLGDGDDLTNQTDCALKLMSSIRQNGDLPSGIEFALLLPAEGNSPIGDRAKRELQSVGWALLQPVSSAAAHLGKLRLWNLTGCENQHFEHGHASSVLSPTREPHARSSAGTTGWSTSTATASSSAASPRSSASTSPPRRSGPRSAPPAPPPLRPPRSPTRTRDLTRGLSSCAPTPKSSPASRRAARRSWPPSLARAPAPDARRGGGLGPCSAEAQTSVTASTPEEFRPLRPQKT